MRRMLKKTGQILSLRLAVIVLSFAQTMLWATKMGASEFGIVSIYLAAQVFASLLARLGADNVIVRNYQQDPCFFNKFIAFLAGIVLFSVGVGMLTIAILTSLVFRAPFELVGAVVFVALVVTFNLSSVLSIIALAQKRQVLSTAIGKVLPMAISVLLFLSLSAGGVDEQNLPYIGLGCLAVGHITGALLFVVPLRGFITKTWLDRERGRRWVPFLGREQWYFLGYQTMGNIRGSGTVIAIAALFGPVPAGVFALANRFGSVLTYLNEPSRLHVMPRVVGKTKTQLASLYRNAVVMNAGLVAIGVVVFVGALSVIPMPFSTQPPFFLYTWVVLTGSVVLVLVGPAGAILALSGNERLNFVANFAGLMTALIAISFAALFGAPLAAVLGAAAASAITNLINLANLLKFLSAKATLTQKDIP